MLHVLWATKWEVSVGSMFSLLIPPAIHTDQRIHEAIISVDRRWMVEADSTMVHYPSSQKVIWMIGNMNMVKVSVKA